MPSTRVEPVEPSAAVLPLLQRYVDIGGPLALGVLRPGLQVTISGLEHFPRQGPVLLLTNHASALDAGILMARIGRPIQFMVTQAGLHSGAGAKVFAAFGAIPKKKFNKDARAVKTLRRWRDVGAAVGLFPEGQRSWDGRTLPLIPGIEKLVRLVDAPMVTGRVLNADRVWPRWAAVPRTGRVHIELDAPQQFDRKTPMEDIRAAVERIRVDPERCQRWPVRGHLLAHGLGNLLFACPHCNAFDRSEERRSVFACRSCGASWTVSTENRLRRAGEDLSIVDAWQRAKDRLEPHWTADPVRFRRDGTVMESAPMRLFEMSEAEPVPVAEGRLKLREDALTVGDWRLPLERCVVTSVEFRRRLQFQDVDGRVFEAVMPEESVVKWEIIVPHWAQRAGAPVVVG